MQYTIERILREQRLANEKEALSQQVLQAKTTQSTVATLAHHINNQLQIASSAVSIVKETLQDGGNDPKKQAKLSDILQACDDSLLHIAAVLRVLKKVTAVKITDYDKYTHMIDIESALRTELDLKNND